MSVDEAGRTVFLNGEFLPCSEAKVSVLDRGFLFGDGVYEVIPVYQGHLFRFGEHIKRLESSLSGIRLANPYSESIWYQALTELVQRNGGGNQSIYLQITRGVAPRDHGFPKDVPATVFVMSQPLKPLSRQIFTNGVSAILLEDIRWQRCHLKVIALLPNLLMRQEALDSGAAEAILVRDGEVTEGAASNVFIVSAGEILTPPKGPRLLPGITRDLVLEIAFENGMAAREASLSVNDLRSAQEIWVTSSTREVVPVTMLDDKPVGDGNPGAVWQRIHGLYQSFKGQIGSTGE